MKKIFAILLAVVVALSMGVTSFAAVEAEVKEYVEVAVTLDSAPFVFDDEGKATSGKHYTFTVNVDNKSKENVNFKDFEVRVVFIDDDSNKIGRVVGGVPVKGNTNEIVKPFFIYYLLLLILSYFFIN